MFPLTPNQVTFWLDILPRSEHRSIDVVINAQAESLEVVQLYKTFVEAVLSHSNRWRKFEITSRTWEPIDVFLRQSKHLVLFSRMEELTLYHSRDPGRADNWEHEDPSPRFHNLLFDKDVTAPMLNIVKLGATYFDYSRARSLVQDLSELHLENHTYPRTSDAPGAIIKLLQASPNLEVLVLASLNLQFTTWPGCVELPHLRRLEFRGFCQSNEHLLSLLRMPALEVLFLGLCRFAVDPGPNTILPLYAANGTMDFVYWYFVSPASTQGCWAGGLKELSLEYGQCHERQVMRLLELTTNVSTFHMACSVIFDILVDNPGILPNLRHLVVDTSIFRNTHPLYAILKNRPSVTLGIKGDLTQEGERLYNDLKDTHDITLHV